MKTGYVLLVAYGLVLAMGIVFGTLAVMELQRTTARLERVVTDSAQTVIDVERLRGASDRLGLAARSYLFTQNARFSSAARDAMTEFREGAEALSERLRGSPSALLLERIREIDRVGQAELEQLLSSARPPSIQESQEIVEKRGQPRRDQIVSLLTELSQAEGLAFRQATHDATLTTTRATRLLWVLATVALAVALALTIALVRTLRLLSRSRKDLERTVKTLEVTNEDLDAFVGRIAHDLRNVISPLGLMPAMLEKKAADPLVRERCADRLRRMARTADGLIDGYLLFARAGQPPSPEATADVARVVADVVEDLAPVALAREARLEVHVDDVTVLCSESFLHTVLMNLIGNGLKYLDGGARRVVSVSARGLGARCEISVADGGPGIPANAQENIFKPFYRVPGVKGPGTGIGLATVLRIVKAHGGRLRVQSAAGQGSTFIVDLPRAGVAGAGERPTSRPAVCAGGSEDLVAGQGPDEGPEALALRSERPHA